VRSDSNSICGNISMSQCAMVFGNKPLPVSDACDSVFQLGELYVWDLASNKSWQNESVLLSKWHWYW